MDVTKVHAFISLFITVIYSLPLSTSFHPWSILTMKKYNVCVQVGVGVGMCGSEGVCSGFNARTM